MADERTRVRAWYGRLLALYPRAFKERLGASMEQTFDDLYRERREAGGALLGFVLWTFVETSAGIVRENLMHVTLNAFVRKPSLWLPAAILPIPLVAMQFTDEVDWDLRDFLIIGVLLFAAGLTYEVLAKARPAAHRAAIGMAVAAVVLFVWAELAVGIVGTPFAGS